MSYVILKDGMAYGSPDLFVLDMDLFTAEEHGPEWVKSMESFIKTAQYLGLDDIASEAIDILAKEFN